MSSNCYKSDANQFTNLNCYLHCSINKIFLYLYTLELASFSADHLASVFYPQRWSVPSRFPRWRAVNTRASCHLPHVATPLILNSPSGRCPSPRSPWIEATPQVLYQHPLTFFLFFLSSSICSFPLLNSWCHLASLSPLPLFHFNTPCSFFTLISPYISFHQFYFTFPSHDFNLCLFMHRLHLIMF